MTILAAIRRRSLSTKLVALGGFVTAAVVSTAFWALEAEIRSSTRDVLTAQLARNQHTLQQLQLRDAQQLLFAASLIAESPRFEAALSTYQLESNAGGMRRDEFVRTVEDELRNSLRSVDADLLVATDDSGRVFAAASRSGTRLRGGTSLVGLAAVRHALDPNAVADSGAMAVLRADSGFVEVAVYPVVQNGFTLGALLVGRRLDAAFVAGAAGASDAEVVLTAGPSIVGASDTALLGSDVAASLARAAARAAAHDAGATLTIGPRGEEYVVAPVSLGDTQDRAPVRVWMLQSLTRRVGQLTSPLRRDFVLYGAVAVIIAAVGAAFVARGVLGPFRRFVAHMRSAAAAEHQQRQFDAAAEALEVRTLNDSFNHLMDSLAARRRELEARGAELVAANVVLTDEISERTRVEQALRESQAQLRQSQKLEAIGTLAGGIAHDFNNLITVISGYTQLALMRTDQRSPEAEDLRQVVEASDRAANLTHQLLAFSRKQVLQPTVLDLSEVVNGIAPMLRRIIGEHLVLHIEAAEPLARIRADRGQLEQVILNLAVNARDAMSGGGTLTIETRNVCEPGVRAALRATRPEARVEARAVTLVVRDTGSGMTAEVKERIFEPFFTTKEPGKGTGLGLSTVYGIVNQSGAKIAVDSELGAGTTFTITFPVAESVGAAEIGETESLELPRGTETVLIVEDAEDVRILARRTLEERGYTVLVARNADEALEIAAARNIDVLLTDIVMPKISGPQLVSRYLATHPTALVMYMSGYADEALSQYELDPATVFLRKPFTPAVLARTLRSALDARVVVPVGGATRVASAAD